MEHAKDEFRRSQVSRVSWLYSHQELLWRKMGLPVCIHELLHDLAGHPICLWSNVHLVLVPDGTVYHSLVFCLLGAHELLDGCVLGEVDSKAERATIVLGNFNR